MAGSRDVRASIFLPVISYLLSLNCILTAGVSDTKCGPWFTAVSKELKVSWSGDDRDATVVVNITTEDGFDRKCNSSASLTARFNTRSLTLTDPCSNTRYIVAASLKCGIDEQKQNMSVRTPPDAPTISTMVPTNISIKVEWSPPFGKIKLYKVILEGGRRNKAPRQDTTTGTSITFSDLEPYTEYSATVSAKNEEHYGKMSTAKTVKTLEGVPFEPENLKAIDVKTTEIALQWEDPETETGDNLTYNVTWIENEAVDTTSRLSTKKYFVIDKLYPYTMYHIRVACVNSVGIGPSANLTQATKLAVPDPPDVEIVEVTNVSASLKWNISASYRGPDPSYALGLKLQTEDKFTIIDLKDISVVNQYTIRHLQPFSKYEVQMRANNDAGLGQWSKELQIKTETGIPSAPRNLKVESKSASSIEISWEIPSPANGVIERYMVAWRMKSKLWRTENTSDAYLSLTNLSPYTEYELKVNASTKVGWGNWSAPLKVKTDVSVPTEPLNLTDLEVTSTSISIEWLPPAHKNGPHVDYLIRWRKIRGESMEDDDYDEDDENRTSNYPVNTTSYEISNLNSYTNYSIQVAAKTSAGLGNYTEPLYIQTIAGKPSYPTGVKVVKEHATSLTLEWTIPLVTNGPLEGYVIRWGVKGTDGSYLRTYTTSYVALGLRPYTEYFFMIAAETKGGQGPFSSIYKRTNISTPSAPRDLASTFTDDHSIILNWLIPEHPNAPYVTYTVQWHQQSADSATQDQDTNATSYTIRNLSPETNYSIQIRAWTVPGEGPWTQRLYVQTRQKDNSSSIIAGSVVGGLLVLFAIASVILYFLAKKKGGIKHIIARKPKPAVKVLEPPPATNSVPLQIINDSEKIKVQNFDEHVQKLGANGYQALAQEFEKLGKESLGRSTNEAKKNDNLTKNRWVKILPFDYSRVKLRPVGDEVEPDFINASYIPGDSHLLEYIATQGPLPSTVNDFWKMVWQESVFLMVMLTQCVERAKRTCERYWPAASSTITYGDLEVHSISESITPAYIQRLFLLTKDGKQRHIVHLHYMNWPVSGSPKNPDDFLSFVRTVRGQISSGATGPMLVHCSAGIGRTGTFIAVDKLTQQIFRSCEDIDVYGTVLELRKFRANLVQTEEQYFFIHLCIQRIVQEKKLESGDDYGRGIYSI